MEMTSSVFQFSLITV
ncbi:hypothetical protein cypCar_00024582 [Cyprinus carpio]|nr:hypothetical protein cypCar_00024582 [Cyprinus carpio]